MLSKTETTQGLDDAREKRRNKKQRLKEAAKEGFKRYLQEEKAFDDSFKGFKP